MTRLSAVAEQISLMVVTALTYFELDGSVGVTAEGGDGTDTVQLVGETNVASLSGCRDRHG